MIRRRAITTLLCSSIALSSVPLMQGCENLPGNEKSQGAVIGGLAGAGAGALIGGKKNRLLGALIGGAAGAGGGYLIGANWDKINGKKKEDAQRANDRAQSEPARAEDARDATSADLNNDGFVTLDEVVAMQKAGLSDKEMITRLRRTQQYFELTPEQEKYLRDRNVDENVIVAMRDMNPEDARTASESRDRSDRPDRSSDRYDRDTGDRTTSRTDRISNDSTNSSDRYDTGSHQSSSRDNDRTYSK